MARVTPTVGPPLGPEPTSRLSTPSDLRNFSKNVAARQGRDRIGELQRLKAGQDLPEAFWNRMRERISSCGRLGCELKANVGCEAGPSTAMRAVMSATDVSAMKSRSGIDSAAKDDVAAREIQALAQQRQRAAAQIEGAADLRIGDGAADLEIAAEHRIEAAAAHENPARRRDDEGEAGVERRARRAAAWALAVIARRARAVGPGLICLTPSSGRMAPDRRSGMLMSIDWMSMRPRIVGFCASAPPISSAISALAATMSLEISCALCPAT